MRLVEHNAWVAHGHGGEPVPERGGEQRPLAAIGMAHDADALAVHFGQAGERLPAIGRDVSMKGQRLALGRARFWLPRVAARGADGEREEPAPCELITKVAQRVCAETHAGLRFVIHDQHRGKRALAVRHEQPTFIRLVRSDFQTDTALTEIFTSRFGEHFQLRALDHRRPRPHQLVPLPENLRAPARPVSRGLHRRAVVE